MSPELQAEGKHYYIYGRRGLKDYQHDGPMVRTYGYSVRYLSGTSERDQSLFMSLSYSC